MNEQNPFEAMMAMGQEWAKAVNPALESFTPQGFEALWPTISEAAQACPSLRHVIVIGNAAEGTISYTEMMDGAPARPALQEPGQRRNENSRPRAKPPWT